MDNIILSSGQLTARKDFSSLVSLKMEIEVNGSWYDISGNVYDQNLIISGSVGDAIADNLGYARSNTASLVLENRNRQFSPKLFQESFDPSKGWFNGPADSDGLGNLVPGLPVRIWEDVGGTGFVRKFTGYVDYSGFQESQNATKDTVSVSFEDEMFKYKSATFDDETVSLPNFMICNPLNPSISLVHILLEMKGFNSNLLICEKITRTIEYLKLTGNLFNIMNELAKAVLGIFTITPEGFPYFGSSPFAEIPKPIESQYELNENLRTIRLISGRKSVKNTIHGELETAEYKESQVVWTNKEIIRINPGELGSPITDPDGEFQCTFGTSNGDKVVYAKNVDDENTFFTRQNEYLSTTKSLSDLGITIDRYEVNVQPDSVGLRLANNTGAIIEIPPNFMNIYGEPLCVLDKVEVNNIDTNSVDIYGTEYEDISSSYITSTEDLQENSEYILERKKQLKDKINAKISEPLTHLLAGTYVDIHEISMMATINSAGDYTDRGLLCRIRTATTNYSKHKATVTLDLDQWTVIPEISFSGTTILRDYYDPDSVLGVSENNNYTINGWDTGIAKGISSQEAINGWDYDGGTTSPSMVKVRVASLYGGTEAEYTTNFGLTNHSHYLVQIHNGSTWVVPDNKSIFGIEGSLRVDGSLYVHVGLEKDIEYTYRVSAVSKAGIQSDWLKYVAKSSSLTEKGIAHDSITANHIKVDSVNVNQLTFTGVGGDLYPVTEKADNSLLYECVNDLVGTDFDELEGNVNWVEDGRVISSETESNTETEFNLRVSKGKYVAKGVIRGRLGVINEKKYIGRIGANDKTIFGGL